jgi:hypothetical protein
MLSSFFGWSRSRLTLFLVLPRNYMQIVAVINDRHMLSVL